MPWLMVKACLFLFFRSYILGKQYKKNCFLRNNSQTGGPPPPPYLGMSTRQTFFYCFPYRSQRHIFFPLLPIIHMVDRASERWKWGGMTPAHPSQISTTNPTFQFLIGRMTSANRSESYKMTDIHPCIHPMTSDNRSTLRATKGFMFRINVFNYHTMKMVPAFYSL